MISKIFRSPLFWIGLGIRLIFLGWMGSFFLKDLFVPFLDQAVLNSGVNPWVLSPPHHFPYGSVLFLFLYIPRALAYFLFGKIALGTGFLGLALIKGPLLLLDFLLFYILAKIQNSNVSKIIFFYWLNPVLIYITYIHGQLDVAAMALALLSIYFLIKDKIIFSSVSMAAALLCKFHVVISVPLILVYIWNRNFSQKAIKKIGQWLVLFLSAGLVGFLPLFLSGNLGYVTATSPEAQRVFASKFQFDSEHIFYIGVMLVVTWLGRLCISTRISNSGLIYGMGSLFAVLLLITNPMPGWYFWIIPFLSLFFASYTNVPKTLFTLLQVTYLTYFVVLPSMTSDPFVLGLGLTLLQTSLLSNLISLIVIVINVELPLQGRARPVRIGLAGDSGAGKNHLSKGLECIFTPKNTLIVEGDDYHLWERGHANWSVMTHLNPQANNLSKLSEHALQLTKGISVFHPHYDHGTGRFTAPRQMSPTKTVIFQGLHTLFLRGFRDELDLRVFLEPERNVRLAWKIKRDQEERGHSIEKVLANMEKREKDALLHINPQRNFADWIVEYYFVEKLTQEEIVAGKTSDLYQRHIFWNDAPVAELVDVLHRIGGCTVKVEVFPESFDRIALIVSGHPSVETIEEMADASFSNMRQITRSWMPPVWQPGFDGINQLIAISLLNAKLTAIK